MKRQTITALQFDTRYCYVSIPEYKEEIQVENKGELAVASLLALLCLAVAGWLMAVARRRPIATGPGAVGALRLPPLG